MKSYLLVVPALLFFVSCSQSKMGEATVSTVRAVGKEIAGTGGEKATAGRVNRADVHAIIYDWQSTPKKIANQMIERYDLPNEATVSRLIWFNNGPWKRTIVYRDEVPHNFPKPHTDLLEQFVNYKIESDKADDVSRYDGSVILERTKGEISARCDMEEMNFLALNLAHDIITGTRSVKDARKFYAETAGAFMMGDRSSPYTKGLLFKPAEHSADLDVTMMTRALVGGASKAISN